MYTDVFECLSDAGKIYEELKFQAEVDKLDSSVFEDGLYRDKAIMVLFRRLIRSPVAIVERHDDSEEVRRDEEYALFEMGKVYEDLKFEAEIRNLHVSVFDDTYYRHEAIGILGKNLVLYL